MFYLVPLHIHTHTPKVKEMKMKKKKKQETFAFFSIFLFFVEIYFMYFIFWRAKKVGFSLWKINDNSTTNAKALKHQQKTPAA